MRISKIVTMIILGICLSTPLTAGEKLGQELLASAKKWTKYISPEDLKKKIDNEDDLYMLDIREPYMIPEGSIEGMENVAIPRGLLEFEVEDKIENKKALVVVYCRSGKGAALSAQMMNEKLKYKNVVYLKGGLDAWLEAGYSVFSHLGELKLVKE
ncbi:rhodanese-like domain-containing protein [Campylobacterota bacterium]